MPPVKAVKNEQRNVQKKIYDGKDNKSLRHNAVY